MKTRRIYAPLLFGCVSLVVPAVAQEIRPVPAAPPASPLPADAQITEERVQTQVVPVPATGVVQVRSAPTEKNASVILKIDSARLVDTAGQLVGKVENVVVNPLGCAEAAIVAGEGGKLIPVPWEMVRFGGETRAEGTPPGQTLTFVAGTDRNMVLAAPGFVRTEWPAMSQNDWMQKSYSYFQVQPGAAVGAVPSSSTVISGTANGTNTVVLRGTNRLITPPPTGRTNVIPPMDSLRTNVIIPPRTLPPGVTAPPPGTPPGIVPPPATVPSPPPATPPPPIVPPPPAPQP